MIKNVLFDLDGTLLPMDQDEFIKSYFSHLVMKFVPLGYDKDKLIKSVFNGTMAMVQNDGKMSNEDVFWATAAATYSPTILDDKDKFLTFYTNEFQNVKNVCGYNPKANEIISFLKQNNIRIILATNPVFPKIATKSRIRWAGLNENDFVLYTTYENSYHCKPNIKYYEDIVSLLNLNPNECVMVGNDVDEDMCAKKLGMDTFLLTDCLINRHNVDINQFHHGNFDDLKKYLIENIKK